MNKHLATFFIWPLLLMALAPSAQAFTVTNATNQCFQNGNLVNNGTTWQDNGVTWTCQTGGGFPILIANGGLAQNYNNTINPGESAGCPVGSYGCGNKGTEDNSDQYMTMARAGAGMGQLCAGSGVAPSGSIVYAFGPSSYGDAGQLWAFVYDGSGNTIWSGPLQGDPKNGHNSNKGDVNTTSSGQLQGTWCGPNSYNP